MGRKKKDIVSRTFNLAAGETLQAVLGGSDEARKTGIRADAKAIYGAICAAGIIEQEKPVSDASVDLSFVGETSWSFYAHSNAGKIVNGCYGIFNFEQFNKDKERITAAAQQSASYFMKRQVKLAREHHTNDSAYGNCILLFFETQD
jgi:hypothetical protein